MAIGGAGIGWDENVPSDQESAALGDDRIRSVKTSVRIGLAAEHVWSSSGGTAGAHLPGSAVAHWGLQSAVSSGDTNGRLMLTSDTSRLYSVAAAGKNYLGGARVISADSFPGPTPQTHAWVEQFGTVITPSAGSSVVTFANSGYSGQPYLFVTSVQTLVAASSIIPIVVEQGATTFIAGAVSAGAYIAGQQLHWRSLGTRSV